MNHHEATEIRKVIDEKISKCLDSILLDCDRIIKLVEGSDSKKQIKKGMIAKRIIAVAHGRSMPRRDNDDGQEEA